MKSTLAAILLLTSPAFAGTDDDYVACLVGRAAVELHAGKSANDAQDAAYKVCPAPALPADIEADGLEDFVNLMVERMAGD